MMNEKQSDEQHCDCSEKLADEVQVKPQRDAACDFHICAIGASAGGLEALQIFFSTVPADLGIVYVVIQHLSPDHDSQMVQLLGRKTSMPVQTVTDSDDGMTVAPDHVYLIPPGKQMVIQNARLYLSDREEDEQLILPIDHFLMSLAEDQGRFSVAVILSGTGGDGSSGVEDIHRTGGLVLVQDPRTAKFDSMPERAIATGLADVILPPAGLAEALDRYIRQSLAREQVDELELSSQRSPASHEILETLRATSGIDFSIYKPKTVMRRIERRQELSRFSSLAEYHKRLETDAAERDVLLNDLLIGVTKFFRDAEAFETLQHEAITIILARKKPGDEVRVWVAGCASGEEAYSLTILFNEAIARTGKSLTLKLFASDVHQAAIDQAGAGVFSKVAVSSLPADLLEKYFVQSNDNYCVIPRIRQQIVFVKHNLMTDAPFTRMDLVTCRNLLIYLQPPAQNKCLSLFHFSLQSGGFLFLGSSEAIGELEDEFEPVNKKWRLYRKLRDVQLAANRADAIQRAARIAAQPVTNFGSELQPGRLTDHRLQQAYDTLLAKMLPAGFLIDSHYNLLHTFGRGGDFLQITAGRHSQRLSELIHPEFKSSMNAAILQCVRENRTIAYSGIGATLHPREPRRMFKLTVEKLSTDSKSSPTFLVSFQEDAPLTGLLDSSGEAPLTVDISVETRDAISALERELTFTRENLQATIQELESSNEELQATNEEMVASNEELQSTNEELQSVNEELHTVNAEYHRKIAQLQDSNDDMDNLLRSSEVAVLFLDRKLSIRRFTPRLGQLFGLRIQDVGRPIAGFQSRLVPDRILESMRTVLQSRKSMHQEIELPDGRTFIVFVTPFDSTSMSDGVVVSYTDATAIREKEDTAERWASIVESTADCIVALDLAGVVTQWNMAAVGLYGWSAEEAIGKNFYDLAVPRDHRGTMAMQAEQVRGDRQAIQFESMRLDRHRKPLYVNARLSPIVGTQGIVGLSLIERDITQQLRRNRLRELEEKVRGESFAISAETGWKSLAAAAVQAFNARSLWVWQVDGLTSQLKSTFSSFGKGETEWLNTNELDLNELARRVSRENQRLQKTVSQPAPEAAPLSRNDRTDATSSNSKSEDLEAWRLLLQPLTHKTKSLGVIGILVSAEDKNHLDEIKRTLAAIAHSLAVQIGEENRLEELVRISDIVENASDFIGTYDAGGKAVFLNRAGRLLTGIGLDEDIANFQMKSFHSADSVETILTAGVPEATRTGHWTGETQIVDRNGNAIPVSQLITSHRDQHGNLRYLSTICRVIADQKNVQSRLEELIHETRSVSETKTTFLANVSHDVRTPMTSVIGLAELMLDEKLSPEHREMLTTIRDNGKYVTELLNDLLDLSRVESGKLTISRTNIDLRSLLQEIVLAFRSVAVASSVALVLDVSGLPEELVSLDSVRVRQIVDNLIANALKFTTEGSVSIIGFTENGFLGVSVADSGCGIEHSMLSSVFDPYTQSPPTSSRRTRGAGLGLAISRKLAEQMGGTLHVESVPGVGSRFALKLPMLPAALDEIDVDGEVLHYPADRKPLAGKRLLVAEDTRAIQFLVQRTLVLEGVDVLMVDNGREAVDKLLAAQATSEPFDAVILDMQMPVLDGYQAAAEIRRQGVEIPMIAMTASTMKDEQKASLDAGCDAFVPKPIDRQLLLATIYNQIGNGFRSQSKLE